MRTLPTCLEAFSSNPLLVAGTFDISARHYQHLIFALGHFDEMLYRLLFSFRFTHRAMKERRFMRCQKRAFVKLVA